MKSCKVWWLVAVLQSPITQATCRSGPALCIWQAGVLMVFGAARGAIELSLALSRFSCLRKVACRKVRTAEMPKSDTSAADA